MNDIIVIEETDEIGWLAYSDFYRAAIYGHTKEEALENIEETIEDIKSDPNYEYDSESNFVIPNETWPSFGERLIETIARWIGHDPEEMKRQLHNTIN